MYISLTISIYLYNRKVPLKPGFLYAIKKSTIHAGAGEFGCKSVRKTLSESEVKAVDALIGETGTLASYRFFFDVVPESAIQGRIIRLKFGSEREATNTVRSQGNKVVNFHYFLTSYHLWRTTIILMHPWKMITPSNIHILRKMR